MKWIELLVRFRKSRKSVHQSKDSPLPTCIKALKLVGEFLHVVVWGVAEQKNSEGYFKHLRQSFKGVYGWRDLSIDHVGDVVFVLACSCSNAWPR